MTRACARADKSYSYELQQRRDWKIVPNITFHTKEKWDRGWDRQKLGDKYLYVRIQYKVWFLKSFWLPDHSSVFHEEIIATKEEKLCQLGFLPYRPWFFPVKNCGNISRKPIWIIISFLVRTKRNLTTINILTDSWIEINIVP